MIAATYISASSFSVIGDKTSSFNPGRRVKTNCGVDGSIYVTVQSSSMGVSDTTILIREATLTSNLTECLYATTDAGIDGSLPAHTHADDSQGGEVPITEMTGASMSAAGTAGAVPAPAAGTITRVFRADGTFTEPDVQSDAEIKRLAIIYG